LYPLFQDELDRLPQTYDHPAAPYLFRLTIDALTGFPVLICSRMEAAVANRRDRGMQIS
jgi:hypothetical protein